MIGVTSAFPFAAAAAYGVEVSCRCHRRSLFALRGLDPTIQGGERYSWQKAEQLISLPKRVSPDLSICPLEAFGAPPMKPHNATRRHLRRRGGPAAGHRRAARRRLPYLSWRMPPRRASRTAGCKKRKLSSNHKLVCPRASAGAGRRHLRGDAHEDRHAPLVDAVDRVLYVIGRNTIQHQRATGRQPDLLRTRSVLPEEATAVLLLVSR